jgi:hypothetical protein
MSSYQRFRSGQIMLQKFRVDSPSVIEPGDLLFLDETVVRPAHEFPWQTDLATTQQSFAAAFVGIAHEQSAAGDETPISVDVSSISVYEFDVPAQTFEFGGLLGPDAVGTLLQDQQLHAVGLPGQAIARTVQYTDALMSRVRVSFASAFTTGSANVNAAIG